jgi:hypothetical protein
MSKHTSGPWKAIYVGCGDWDLQGPVTQEDWTLAAAAPDLLEALMMAVSALERSDYIQMDSFDVIEVSRAAIAKARDEA